MSEAVDRAEFIQLLRFINACERAAVPPPLKPANALLALAGLARGEGLFEVGSPATRFEQLDVRQPVGVTFDEELPNTRSGRIAVLSEWMTRYPAHVWLRSQPPVRGALASFNRIRARKRQNPRYTDDMAEFRFWRCAAQAAAYRDLVAKPSPNAAQRTSAEKAVRVLQQLTNRTSLVDDVGLDWTEAESLRLVLAKLLTIGKMKRRRRLDAHTSDREYVEALTTIFWLEFKAASPAPIIALAGLKVLNPDSAALTKRIKALAVTLAGVPR